MGVLDVGSNTVHLLIVDATPGAPPVPATSLKLELRLAEHLDPDASIDKDGCEQLVEFISHAVEHAEDSGAREVLGFATSAIREASNGEELLNRVKDETGVTLTVLSGADEARLTFLAVRRWYGWSSRRLLVLDIGGGSLELAVGSDEDPEMAFSLPLGAGRLTRSWFPSDPPEEAHVRALRRHVRAEVAGVVGPLLRPGRPDHVVATSKTFRSLARICGAAPRDAGPYVERFLRRADLVSWLPRLADMDTTTRADLPGVSPGRASQLLAGALVADAAMDLLGLSQLEICPWALREGVLLQHLDALRVTG